MANHGNSPKFECLPPTILDNGRGLYVCMPQWMPLNGFGSEAPIQREFRVRILCHKSIKRVAYPLNHSQALKQRWWSPQWFASCKFWIATNATVDKWHPSNLTVAFCTWKVSKQKNDFFFLFFTKSKWIVCHSQWGIMKNGRHFIIG